MSLYAKDKEIEAAVIEPRENAMVKLRRKKRGHRSVRLLDDSGRPEKR